ncbi:hypothetical protein RUND412_006744 [Rhizina undulata]
MNSTSAASSTTASSATASSATASSATASSATASSATASSLNALTESAGKAQSSEGLSLQSFLASLSVAAVIFGVEVLFFILLRRKLQRVYEPRTYLVPENRRTKAPPPGLLDWFKPIFATANSDFINKSGLDAYFFLRYLLMLLKIFCILAVFILPILLPLNSIGGRGEPDVKGLDQLAWTNVAHDDTDRYWAHLLLAIGVVLTCFYMFYRELRSYIRLRQAWLTSPQHRLRASATTVLVNGIPRKWLSVEALMGLYDVFPGGIRNVWINRDYEELAEKVEERNKVAKLLERAETELIMLAKKKHMKELRKAAKKNPAVDKAAAEAAAAATNEHFANGPGLSSGNPHQIPGSGPHQTDGKGKSRSRFIIPVVGEGLQKIQHGVMGGVGVVTGGVRKFGEFMPKQGHGTQSGDASNDVPAIEEPEATEEEPEGHDQYGRRKPRRGSTLKGTSPSPDRGRSPASAARASVPAPIDTASANTRANTTNLLGKQEEEVDAPPHFMFWKKRSKVSDQHKRGEEDETPLGRGSPTATVHSIIEKYKKKDKTEYPVAFDLQYGDDDYEEPVWKKYIKEKERPTMRLPIYGIKWLPALPFLGKKVDTIYYCRKELARLNVEIEHDQSTPEKYPLMNSAFIQFNHQVAAHMACQSVSHHVPLQMAPRQIEVSPDDVIWGNMKMTWWQRYIRVAAIYLATGGLIIGWAFPVAFVGLVSQIDYLTNLFKWLAWLNRLPQAVLGLISGVLPPLGLAILMALLPIILRTFARIQGCHTGMAVERSVQGMYFAFLFTQVFLVVSISSGITAVIKEILDNPVSAPTILAQNLPKSSNFFFSYLLLQAFTVSGGALLQIGTLVVSFILSPILDKTAREKFTRATTLSEMKWGTFFPVYTNLACIGLVYSVISPLILVFNILTFSLFWVVYRYNLLYVNNHRFDTGGILFPRAINQLFTGIYVLEVCLIGLFLLVRDSQGRVACLPHAMVMVVVTIGSVAYQFTLNSAFGPLLTYLPITLEDDAVIRDEEFAKENDERRRLNLIREEQEGDDLNKVLEERERRSMGEDTPAGIELEPMDHEKPDVEAQETFVQKRKNRQSRAEYFEDIADDIEDLSPEERDKLVQHAFQHEALRSKRPVIWIPRDDLGISDDEIRRTQKFTENIWISNEWAGLDGKGKVVFRRSPPDFDVRDLAEL